MRSRHPGIQPIKGHQLVSRGLYGIDPLSRIKLPWSKVDHSIIKQPCYYSNTESKAHLIEAASVYSHETINMLKDCSKPS